MHSLTHHLLINCQPCLRCYHRSQDTGFKKDSLCPYGVNRLLQKMDVSNKHIEKHSTTYWNKLYKEKGQYAIAEN